MTRVGLSEARSAKIRLQTTQLLCYEKIDLSNDRTGIILLGFGDLKFCALKKIGLSACLPENLTAKIQISAPQLHFFDKN